MTKNIITIPPDSPLMTSLFGKSKNTASTWQEAATEENRTLSIKKPFLLIVPGY
jgi:hypothetical protein